ncbi:IMS domain-containing protein [Brevibacterium sp. FAM 27836]|uniref:IMS domain-containing protein n=1 Tax=Brevibacterium sp. FAM 27836 TaxID=3446693 RepID=UPI003F51A4AA
MRTGTTRPHRRPALLFVALFAALSLLSLAGCAGSSPVAVPTSTLSEEQPDDSSTDGTAEVEVPKYETDLDLSEEEKEAVDGALVAFAGYIETINRVFSSGGKDSQHTETFARDGSLKSINSEAHEMRSTNTYMAGEYRAYDVQIESVEIDSAPADQKVSVLFCTKDSEWSVVPDGEPLPSSSPKGLTMQYEITHTDEKWKVANQYLRSKQCASV